MNENPKNPPKTAIEGEATSGSDELNEYWDDFQPAIDIPRMSETGLREFVLGVLDGRIYIDRQAENPAMVFYPLLFGALSGYHPESLKKRIGCIYEYLDKALPRSVNGQPCFMSMQILHAEDWKRAHAALVVESERRKNIPI